MSGADPIYFPNVESSDWMAMSMPEGDSFDARLDPYQFRKVAAGKAEALFETNSGSQNGQNGLHGGFLAARAEQVLYLPLYVNRSVALGRVVIIDMNLQYVAGGTVGVPLLAEVELIQETGRMGFTRGLLKQEGRVLTSFTSTIRKLPEA
ncbi:PaaI family thioesterase [Zhongshania sp. BJYM1]|uniref:PaaI family thioesterase n=1 Tax=Zhongshania aquatica TaxID=2965069 RepID=UPI0022B37EFE|nr:PaaI family thioesterase [Marortus sp. BJYM1]